MPADVRLELVTRNNACLDVYVVELQMLGQSLLSVIMRVIHVCRC